MFKSVGIRYLIVGFLILLMSVPLFFVSTVVNDRANWARQATNEINKEWGGSQTITGPYISIPVNGKETRKKKEKKQYDPISGKYEFIEEEYEVTVRREPIYLLPRELDQALDMKTQTRSRGLFDVPVYTADVDMNFDFNFDPVKNAIGSRETIIWDKAELLIGFTSNRALRGKARLTVGDNELLLEPRNGTSGLYSQIGNPLKNKGAYKLTLAFNGAKSVYVTAGGRNTVTNIKSDWAHPSFRGTFLPDSREVRADGFDAAWSVPHFARSIAQFGRGSVEQSLQTSSTMGVELFQPNDFYQKAFRAGRYGILFISLTFLIVLLMEQKGRPTHPVQYILIGVAQSLFVLLMVAFAEQIGFTPAYILAAGATIGVLTMFGATALQLGKRTGVMAGFLTLLYAVLYLILRSEDYALLAGSTLAFGALAGTMYATRNEDWYGRLSDVVPKRAVPKEDVKE